MIYDNPAQGLHLLRRRPVSNHFYHLRDPYKPQKTGEAGIKLCLIRKDTTLPPPQKDSVGLPTGIHCLSHF